MSLHNLIHIGVASLAWSQGNFSLSIDWKQEIPPARQIDITVFLVELFKFNQPGNELLREYTRISMISDHLYGFDIIEIKPTINVQIYSSDEEADLQSINPHHVKLRPQSSG
ncbi:hypothetical protein KSF_107980 [Reticulibacter mediterranei]|uniref:Uncharacterized protein n=1 Tax=Reticulibacter mediterranei TaxID=2778369 RepID=A0A8J3N9M4_9CHLR|nr:hypothetical protein [Reticulibacter mediterranei]GHP00751.1 hypothetical protein KSF_107980 [Reticulibacter mediterranei]